MGGVIIHKIDQEMINLRFIKALMPVYEYLSGYQIFVREQRPTIVMNNPTAKVTEVAKLLAAAWSQLSLDQKVDYNDRAKLAALLAPR